MGRPNKYYTNVEPYLDKIKEMALTMTERQIAETLDVGYTAFRSYKKQYPALLDSLQKGRKDLVLQLKSALIKKAMGFEYTETSETFERAIDGDGELSDELIVTKREVKKKQTTPDVAAINLLLKNYDKDNWSNDPQMLRIREQELKLKEKQIENNEW